MLNVLGFFIFFNMYMLVYTVVGFGKIEEVKQVVEVIRIYMLVLSQQFFCFLWL